MAKKKIVIPILLGNIIEYYDFGVYAVFTSSIGALFFRSTDPFMQLMLAFFVFAIGFLMRPIGGILFGHIGDILGRKIALKISMIGMALSTLAIGLLPTYEQIGAVATFLLLLVRMIQGLCIGGESSGSAIYMMEHLTNSRINVIGSVMFAAHVVGTLLANLVGIIITRFIGLDDFTWRYGFMFGAILGFIGIYMRTKAKETPVFDSIKQSGLTKKMPITQIMISKKYSVLLVVSVSAAATSIAYLLRGYLKTFLLENLGYSEIEALLISFAVLSNLIIWLVIFGFIMADIEDRIFLTFCNIMIIVAAYPLFYIITAKPISNFNVIACFFILSILCAAISSRAYSYAIKAFPPELRYSGVAFAWNLGNALFGGTTPVICTYLSNRVGNFASSFYIMGTASLFLIANFVLMIIIKYKKKKAYE